MKKTTSKIEKAKGWIHSALLGTKSVYFRFVDYRCGTTIYGTWLTPEIAHKQISGHNEMNTLRVEMKIF